MTAPFDLIVIGTGVAGITATKLAQQAGLSTAMIEANLFGGLITNINDLDGPFDSSGSDYAASLMSAACDLGAENISATVSTVEQGEEYFTVKTDNDRHTARAIIVASGGRIRHLGVPGEEELEGRGVSRCADCDGPLFNGEEVVVVGGGDSAVQEAIALAAYARRVHIVHRGETFRARAHLTERLVGLRNVTVHWHTRVQAILGSDGVRAVETVSPDGVSGEMACAGVFPYIGLEPASTFLPESVARDASGYIVTDDAMRTALPGLFAAGVVRAGNGGTISDAEADAAAAARSMLAFLRG